MDIRPHNPKRTSALKLLQNTVLILVCSLAFLVPFPLGRSIDLQGVVLLLTGLVAWSFVLLSRGQPDGKLAKIPAGLLAVYVASCLISVVTHFGEESILGLPLMRLGALGLVACVGCGLALQSISTKRLIMWIYATTCLLAITALPYAYLLHHPTNRLGGVFSQSTILAVFAACGLLLGVYMWLNRTLGRRILLASQTLLFVVLCWTQTRAVLILLLLTLLTITLCSKLLRWQKILIISVLAGITITGGVLGVAISNRVSNVEYMNESVRYRMALQQAGLESAFRKPLQGYGAGSIENAFPCKELENKALLKTCEDGFFFASSHNIFLDRILAIGVVGGLSYIAFVVLGLYVGFRSKDQQIQILACCALLITGYYLTNVTNIALELIFMTIVLHILPSKYAET